MPRRGLDDRRDCPARSTGAGSSVPGTAGTPTLAGRAGGHASLSPRASIVADDGPDEDEPGRLDRPRERGALREEPVARVDRLGAASRRAASMTASIAQVALRRRRRSEPDGRVGHADVRCVGVRVAVDRDRLDPELVAGADDADRDLAAVRDRTRGRVCVRATASLRKDSRFAPPDSERDVAMLLPRVRVALVREHLQGAR